MQPWSVLLTVAPAISEGLVDAYGMGHISILGPCCHETLTDLSGLCSYLGPPRDILEGSVTEGHIWVHSPAAAGVYIDVCSLCYHQASCQPFVLKYEGSSELAPLFASPGRYALAPSGCCSGKASQMTLILGELVPPLIMGTGELTLMVLAQESWFCLSWALHWPTPPYTHL